MATALSPDHVVQVASPIDDAAEVGLSAEQHAVRRKGIGSSDVSAVLGLSKYRTPFDVWLAKLGTVTIERGPATGPQQWGHRMEPVLADTYVTGLQEAGVPAWARPVGTFARVEHPWALATPDRLIETVDGDAWLLEMKTRSQWQAAEWGEAGTDQVPHDVAVQAHWQMLVLGVVRCDVAVLIGGNDYRTYRLDADAALHADLLDQVGTWRERHIVGGIEPPLTGEGAEKWIAGRFPRVKRDALIDADAETTARLARLAEVKAAKKAIEWEEANLAAEIKKVIGEAKGVRSATGDKALWYQVNYADSVDWEAAAREAGVSQEILRRHTSLGRQSRTFKFTPGKGE